MDPRPGYIDIDPARGHSESYEAYKARRNRYAKLIKSRRANWTTKLCYRSNRPHARVF